MNSLAATRRHVDVDAGPDTTSTVPTAPVISRSCIMRGAIRDLASRKGCIVISAVVSSLLRSVLTSGKIDIDKYGDNITYGAANLRATLRGRN